MQAGPEAAETVQPQEVVDDLIPQEQILAYVQRRDRQEHAERNHEQDVQRVFQQHLIVAHKTLKAARTPADFLPDQPGEGVGDVGADVTEALLDLPAPQVEFKGQVLVLGDGVERKAVGIQEGLAPDGDEAAPQGDGREGVVGPLDEGEHVVFDRLHEGG